MRAEILQHFPFIVKHLMIWFEPGLYLNLFLAAMSHTLGMVNAYEQLFTEKVQASVFSSTLESVERPLWGMNATYIVN